jgi:hypothetical protein
VTLARTFNIAFDDEKSEGHGWFSGGLEVIKVSISRADEHGNDENKGDLVLIRGET